MYSQPVNAWKAGRFRHDGEPNFDANSVQLTSLLFWGGVFELANQISDSETLCILASKIIKTSVSEAFTKIFELRGAVNT